MCMLVKNREKILRMSKLSSRAGNRKTYSISLNLQDKPQTLNPEPVKSTAMEESSVEMGSAGPGRTAGSHRAALQFGVFIFTLEMRVEGLGLWVFQGLKWLGLVVLFFGVVPCLFRD